MHARITLTLVVVALAAGCSMNPSRYSSETNAVDMTGAFQLVPRDDFEEIDLARLLDPKGEAAIRLTAINWQNLNQGQKIDTALDQFYRSNPTKAGQRSARDRIQERILAASTQRCNAFKTNMQREFSRTNFVLGLSSTISGVLGAVVPGVQASKNLAGASGIFGGARAEWNQDFLSNVAVSVIIDGIEQRQQDVYKQILVSGQSKDIDAYNVEAAIKDALFFHGQCTVMTGLRVASDAIKTASDPGIDAATRILLKLNNARKIGAGATDADFQIGSKIDQLALNQRMYAGTLRGNDLDPGSLLRVMYSAKQRIGHTADILKASIEKFEGKKDTEAQKALLAVRDALLNGIKGCDSKASAVTNEIAETQAKLENSTGDADKINYTGMLETKIKLSSAIAREVDLRQTDFANLALTLQSQADAKGFKPEDAKKRVDEQFKTLKTGVPGVCT